MSYNFDLNIIDCSAFSELATELSKAYSSPQDKVNETGMNLVWQFSENLKQQGRMIPARNILQFHRGFDTLGVWSALAEVYTDLMPLLPLVERQAYDAIYLPLVGPWVEDGEDETRVNDIFDDTGCLAKHGINWVLGPDRCKDIANLLRIHSFSRLIHLVYARSGGLPTDWRGDSFMRRLLDSSDIQTCEFHAELSSATDAWRILFEQARKKNWGLWITGEG